LKVHFIPFHEALASLHANKATLAQPQSVARSKHCKLRERCKQQLGIWCSQKRKEENDSWLHQLQEFNRVKADSKSLEAGQ
jgi:hypothetical protein